MLTGGNRDDITQMLPLVDASDPTRLLPRGYDLAVPDPYVQSLAGIDLTIEQATERTPDEKLFHVFYNGEVVRSYKKLPAAQEHFRKIRDESDWQPDRKSVV